MLCSQRWRRSIQSAKARPGADCGSDHELLLPNSDLKKVRKTSRPFKYNQNQIPYYYTVEVTHRFKGLDMIECLKNYGWRFLTLYKRQWSRPSPRKKMQKGKMVVWGGLTNSWENKRSKRQRRKGKIYPSECRVAKKRRDKKAFLSEQWKEIEENNRMGKTRYLFKKTVVIKGTLHARVAP